MSGPSDSVFRLALINLIVNRFFRSMDGYSVEVSIPGEVYGWEGAAALPNVPSHQYEPSQPSTVLSTPHPPKSAQTQTPAVCISGR